MPTWTVTREHRPTQHRTGTEPTWPAAWHAAFDAALTEFEDVLEDGWCLLTVDGAPAALNAGRHDNGKLDLPQTRAGAGRMLAAITGEPELGAGLARESTLEPATD